jgi:hypothetical protein
MYQRFGREPVSALVALKRVKGKPRVLANFDKILEVFRKEMNDAQRIETTGLESVVEAAKFISAVRILFGVLGAAGVNILYMQPRTAYLEVHGDVGLLSNWNISWAIGVYHIVTRLIKMGHFENVNAQDRTLPLPMAKEMIMTAITLLSAAESAPLEEAGAPGGLAAQVRQVFRERQHLWEQNDFQEQPNIPR